MLQTSKSYLLKYFFLLLFLSTLSLSCQKKGDNTEDIIAQTCGKYDISFNELRQYVYDWHLDKMYRRNKSVGYEKGLDEMIVKQLKIADFFDLGLNEKQELIQDIIRTINEELVIEYYQTQYYDKYINEKSVADTYKQMNKEVVYQRIVLFKPIDAPQGYIDTLRMVAAEIQALLDNGTDFSELAKRYSQDARTAGSGGVMPAINWKTSMSTDFNNIIFNYDSSDEYVYEDKQSIIIAKIIQTNKLDVPPIEEVSEEIKKALKQRYTDISLKEFYEEKENILDKNSLNWDTSALSQIVSWSNIPDFYKSIYLDTLNNAISEGNNFRILEHSKGIVDLKEYRRLLNDILTWGNFASIKEDEMKKFLIEALQTDLIVKKARELDLEKNIFHPGTKNPALRRDILRLYNQHVIYSQIPEISDSSLRFFYKGNKDSLFYQLRKVNIYAIIDSSRQSIEKLLPKVKTKIPFEKIADKILVKTFIINRDGTIQSSLSPEPPFLGEAAFKLKLNETAGPIEYDDPEKGKQYALIKCVGLREEKQLTYEDVKETIAEDYKKYHKEKMNQAAVEKLKKKYAIKIYDDVLKKKLSLIGINADVQK